MSAAKFVSGWVALVSLAAGVAPGCSQYRALRHNAATTRVMVDSLTRVVSSLQETARGQHELLRLVRAEQQVRFTELEKSVFWISGNLIESQQRLSKIDEKTQALKEGWQAKARADSLLEVSRQAEIDALFQVAMGDYLAGRRAIARAGFHDIVERFGSGARVEEALYWYGECQYALKEFDAADQTFQEYLRKYPDGVKICAVLLKMGFIQDHRKKNEARDLLWNTVVERCAASEEAAVAAGRLNKQ